MEPVPPIQPLRPTQPINPAALTDRAERAQNLVDLSKGSVSPTPPGFWRSLSLDVLSVTSAFLFGYSYFSYLTEGISPWYPFAALLAFAILSGLQMFLAEKASRRVGIILAETVLMTIMFVRYDSVPVILIAAGVVFLFLLWGFFGGRSEVQNEVEIRFFKATANVIGKVTSAAILFLLIVYAPQAQGQGIFIPRSSFRTLFSWSSGFLDNLYPGVTLNGTFGDFASGFVKSELANNPSFAKLPPSSQNAALNQATEQFSQSVAQTIGSAPSSSTPVSDVAYDYIVATLSNWQGQFDGQFVVVWVIVLFLVFRFLGYLFVFIAQLVMLLVYEILLAAKFMRIQGVPQTKETLQY